ncbi:GNAT family N-acetyltransferase [Tahibacter caeni]|uniref:GNAT family N-acetyltransferase n=1 Tax=Tahibacter caeni TaxID=1453545 RepID=UPI002148F7D7|nr:GNAT family N-acetyltransferase [Tahibacter caeni]
MATRLLTLRAADRAAHERFHAFVPLTFRSVDFRRWEARGGWNEDYTAWLLEDDADIVASVGVTRMRLVLDGLPREGYQLGAVATHPERRGRGHSRALLEAVLAELGAAPVLLFANERVLDFYPRFGFRAAVQRRFVADAALQPAAAPARHCDVADVAARAGLAALCAEAIVNDAAFGARDYYSTLLWHLTYRAIDARWLDDGNAVAAVERDGDTLILHDLIARRPFDLAAALAAVVDSPVARIEFGFRPYRWWPDARDAGACAGSPLFVRHLPLPDTTLRFPDLAQT